MPLPDRLNFVKCRSVCFQLGCTVCLLLQSLSQKVMRKIRTSKCLKHGVQSLPFTENRRLQSCALECSYSIRKSYAFFFILYLPRFILFWNLLNKDYMRSHCWRDSSAVQRAYCTCRGPGFDSLQVVLTDCNSSSRRSDTLFWTLCTSTMTYSYLHTHN